jgi:hypothetical protein
VTDPALALERAVRHPVGRLAELEGQAHLDSRGWSEYAAITAALATALAVTREPGRLLSTRELAQQYGLAPKTILAMKKAGKLTPAVVLGARGKGAIRWRSVP